jgi:hypothetical protein
LGCSRERNAVIWGERKLCKKGTFPLPSHLNPPPNSVHFAFKSHYYKQEVFKAFMEVIMKQWILQEEFSV